MSLSKNFIIKSEKIRIEGKRQGQGGSEECILCTSNDIHISQNIDHF